MSLPETRLKHRFSKINVQTLSGERVHSIAKHRPIAQGGFLKKIFTKKIHAFIGVFFSPTTLFAAYLQVIFAS